MIGSDRAEVSAIQCCYFPHIEPFGDGQDSGVDSAEREVGVLPHQLGHPQKIGPSEIDEFDFLVRDRFQEPRLCRRTDPRFQEIADFRENWTWNQ